MKANGSSVSEILANIPADRSLAFTRLHETIVIYADPTLLNWFVTEYPKHTVQKLDMGKSCIRFKKFDQIPFELIGQLMKKMSVQDWINIYEKNMKK